MAFTQVSSLDYADIKTALREYLRKNTTFTDYDFESSTLSAILDLLAYNTYYTAFNTTMAVNETFITSASLRDNIVKVAKQLGYTPKSKTSSKATVTLSVNFNDIAASNPNLVPRFVTLKKGNCFIASNPLNRTETYQFAVLEDIIAPVESNIAYFSNVDGLPHLDITEGVYLTYKFTVDSSIPNQRFIIPTENIDTKTINVYVRENSSSASIERYTPSENILNARIDDKVFFVNESDDKRYELVFGDGVVGRKLLDGEVIEISYLVSSAENSNNVNTFVFSGQLYDQDGLRILNNISVSTISSAAGGDDVESAETIKINAPKFYSSQNRAVTLDDFKIILRNIYPSIADIIVYGGEEESPPEYGRVKISIKPKFSDRLSNSTKRSILTELKKYTVASVIPVIIDPSIVEVFLDSKIYYDVSATNLSPEQIKALTIQNLNSYKNSEQISRFNGTVKHSKLSTVIDSADDAITSNNTKLYLRKKLIPALNTKAQYLLCYVNPFDPKCGQSTIKSTKFRVADYPNSDVYLENIADGTIRIYTIDPVTADKVILFDDVGRVNFSRGEVSLDLINIISGSNENNEIFITATPLNPDIFAVREVYLDLSLGISTFNIIQETT